MRTIIINTLGEEVPQYELLFLPFGDDRLVWLNTNMGGIGACAEQIENLYNAQDKRQDYRLIVLADLGGYEDVDRDEIRSCYRSVLGAYMNVALFQPLADEKKIPPKSVTVIYLITRIVRGSGKLTANREYEYVLGIPGDRPFQTLKLVRKLDHGREEHLDVTDVCRSLIKASGVAKSCEDPETHKANLNHFRKHLPNTLASLQVCRYTLSGSMQSGSLHPDTVEFFPKCTSPELIGLDLQLNLCELLARQGRLRRDVMEDVELVAHDEEELAFRFRRGLNRVRLLLAESPAQTFFPVHNGPEISSQNLTNKIWTALMEKKELLPGVQEADNHRRGIAPDKENALTAGLRKAWFRIDREKARFESLYAQLQREYDPEVTGQQQQAILELCAGEFRSWRSDMLAARAVMPKESEAVPGVIPKPQTEDLEVLLHQAQTRCSAMAADKLEEYLDLRQEAEEIRAEFRKSARIWKPDCRKANTRHFLTYSLVLAVLFLIQMVAPYVGITMGQSGAGVSGYLHLFTGIAAFIGLYALGLMIWLRQICRELSEHNQRMASLILRSGQRRVESIEGVVRAYGQELPACTILYEQLQERRRRHALNLDRYARYRNHMNMLKRAEELLQEMETRLQLPEADLDAKAKAERVGRGISYQQSPDYTGNIAYYMLLSDEWGERAC